MISNTTNSKASGASWKQLISTLLLILAVVGIALVAAITLGITAGWMRTPQNAVATIFTGTIIGELAAFGLLVWQLRRRGQTLRDIGWGQPTRWWAIALGIGVAFVYSGFTALNPGVGHHLLDFSLLKLLAIVTAIVAGLVEETIFRGYVITTLGRMGYGLVVQVLLSGLFFYLLPPVRICQSVYYSDSTGVDLSAWRCSCHHLSRRQAQPDSCHHQPCPDRHGH